MNKTLFLFCIINIGYSQENNTNINKNLKAEEETVAFKIIESVPFYKGCNEKLSHSALKNV